MAGNTPEGKVKTLISKWLKERDIPYWMVIPNAMGRSNGMSDYVCILPNGKWLAIEAKSAGKKSNVTANQQKFLDTVNAKGGLAVVVDSQEDLDALGVSIAYMIDGVP
jgi:hypothetical protein